MPKIDVSLEIPITGSPVPTLCSVHTTNGRGDYGDSRFRGNCSGALIKDVLEYFNPANCLDPMAGSKTCGDVCQELGIMCHEFDLSIGCDATDMAQFIEPWARYEFVWLHPPYWDMIKYNDDPRCLSQCKSFHDYLQRLSDVIGNALTYLAQDGHLAILIGDIIRGGECYQLPFHCWHLAAEVHGLRLAVPEIIRLQHGATSTQREYTHAFIPRLHDVLMVFKRS